MVLVAGSAQAADVMEGTEAPAVAAVPAAPRVAFAEVEPEDGDDPAARSAAGSSSSAHPEAVGRPYEEAARRPSSRHSTTLPAVMRRVTRRLSSWRWPRMPGNLPIYVQRSFRLKVFGLITFQLMIVFCVMLVTDGVLHREGPQIAKQGSLFMGLFYSIGSATLLALVLLHVFRQRFPLNYFILAANTVLVGIFWGFAGSVFTLTLHFQVVGVMVVAMFLATVLSAALTHQKLDTRHMLLASLTLGWLAGSVLDLMVAPTFGVPLSHALVAIGVALLLFCCLLGMAGSLLVQCNPDDFMRVVVVMDAALLVVPSIPFFLVALCLIQCGSEGLDAAAQAEADDDPV